MPLRPQCLLNVGTTHPAQAVISSKTSLKQKGVLVIALMEYIDNKNKENNLRKGGSLGDVPQN
jgi:hypothetical protein